MTMFLVSVMSFFMACFGVIMFFCACIIGLCVLDYLLDLDIKGSLVRVLGPRKKMKLVRSRTERLLDKLEEPTFAEKNGFNRHL